MFMALYILMVNRNSIIIGWRFSVGKSVRYETTALQDADVSRKGCPRR